MTSASGDRQLTEHLGAARKRVLHLHGLAAKTDAAERRILEGATARLGIVRTELAKLRSRALLDDAAGDSYAALTQEAGTLETTIAESRRQLGM